MKGFDIGGKRILVAKIRGTFYSAEAVCPHLGGNLLDGNLNGSILTCPEHHSQFDLTTGAVVRWTDLSGIILTLAKKTRPPHPLTTYVVKVDGEKLLVDL